MLASRRKDGYVFFVIADGDKFSVEAIPRDYGEPGTRTGTGTRSFFTDETGVIRYTSEDRPPTADDPPL